MTKNVDIPRRWARASVWGRVNPDKGVGAQKARILPDRAGIPDPRVGTRKARFEVGCGEVGRLGARGGDPGFGYFVGPCVERFCRLRGHGEIPRWGERWTSKTGTRPLPGRPNRTGTRLLPSRPMRLARGPYRAGQYDWHAALTGPTNTTGTRPLPGRPIRLARGPCRADQYDWHAALTGPTNGSRIAKLVSGGNPA